MEAEKQKQRKLRRKEYMKKYYANYSIENPERIKEKNRQYYLKNRIRINNRNKVWMEKNKSKFNRYLKVYYAQNREKILDYGKKWYNNQDKEEYRRKKREWERDSRKNNLNYLIKKRLRCRIWHAFQKYLETGRSWGKSKKYGIDYGVIIKRLLEELPKDFVEKNYEIDHIKPLASFDLTDPNQIKIAFAPENHQWFIAEGIDENVDSLLPLHFYSFLLFLLI